MLIKKVKKRLIIILISTALLLLSITYLLKNLEKNILYFFSPTQISNDPNVIIDKEEIRVGGMVKEGSVFMNSDEINEQSKILGIIPTMLILKDLNKIKNIIKIDIKINPNDFI